MTTEAADLDGLIKAQLAAGQLAAAATTALSALGPQILGYLCATLRDDDAAYDVFGQFSEELWKSIGKFRGESSFKTYAYKVVMHSVSRYRRDAYRRRGRPFEIDEISQLVAEIRTRTEPFRRSEVKDRIAQLREQLEPEEQTLLFLRVDQGLAWNDVAAIVAEQGEAIAVPALRKRFERAKARLRQLAEQEGLLGD